MNDHFSSARGARHQARRRDRPRVDHRIGAAIPALLDRRDRIEREPSRVCADKLAHSLWTKLRTHQRKHERLGNAHDWELAVGVATGEDAATYPDQRDAEQIAIDSRQCRIDLRVLTFSLRSIALIRFADHALNLFRWRKPACGYKPDARLCGLPLSWHQ